MIKMKRFLCYIFTGFSLTVSSQEHFQSPDTVFIENMDNKITLKLDVDNDIEAFAFDDGNTSFSITPNIDYKTELSLNYRFISFKIGYAPNLFSNNDDDLKGKTEAIKFRTDLYIKNWIQTLEYYKITGFYLSDYKDPNNSGLPNGEEFAILPDLRTIRYRGITRYKINPNFSLKALTTQNEIQRKSSGSFIPSLEYSYFEIMNKSIQQDTKTLSLILGAGYFHTFVINKKWYTGVGITPGVGMDFNYIKQTIDSNIETNRDQNFVLHLDSNLGIGYNSKRFFGGLYFNFIASTLRDNSIIQFDTTRRHYQIFVGYRFKAPKFAEKGVDWIEKTTHMN